MKMNDRSSLDMLYFRIDFKLVSSNYFQHGFDKLSLTATMSR